MDLKINGWIINVFFISAWLVGLVFLGLFIVKLKLNTKSV